MAIAGIGGSFVTSATDIVFNDPGTSGAVLIASVGFSQTSHPALITPSGWVKLDTESITAVGTDFGLYYKASATGSGTYTFQRPGSGSAAAGQIYAFSGVDATTQIDVLPVTAPTISNAFNFEPITLTSPSTSPTDTNCMVLFIAQLDAYLFGGNYTYTAPTGGFTEFNDGTFNYGGGPSIGMQMAGKIFPSSGATGTISTSLTSPGGGASGYAVYAIALKPSGAAPATPHNAMFFGGGF